MKIKKLIYLFIVLVVSCGMILGCRGQERPVPNSNGQKDREKVPKALETMDEKIHSIITNIEGIEEVTQTKPEDLKPPEEQTQQGGQQSGGQQSGAQQSGGQSDQQAMLQQQPSPEEKQQKKQMEKQAQVLEKWQKSEENVKSLHESWNGYESSALKDGADQEKVNKMETALNHLTSGIEEKSQDKVLTAANGVILSLSDFMGLYKGNADGTLAKIEYMARQSHMDAKGGDWKAAIQKVDQKDFLVDTLRQVTNLKEKQKPLLDKLNLSIEDFKKAIEQKDLPLVEIKRDIVVKNIETLKNELK